MQRSIGFPSLGISCQVRSMASKTSFTKERVHGMGGDSIVRALYQTVDCSNVYTSRKIEKTEERCLVERKDSMKNGTHSLRPAVASNFTCRHLPQAHT